MGGGGSGPGLGVGFECLWPDWSILDSARDATEHMDSSGTGDPVGASVGGGLEVTPSKSAQPCGNWRSSL